MKCPKCQYIGFDTGDRCRNCGYEFALLLAPSHAADGAPEALDLTLHATAGGSPQATPALPLFQDDNDPIDEPLVRTAAPRPPVAVRKTPEPQRQHLSRTVSIDTPANPALQFAIEPPAPGQDTEAASPPPRPTPAKPQRADFTRGDKVSFVDRHLHARVGIVTRVNQRTATVECEDASSWRVPFHMLRHVMDI